MKITLFIPSLIGCGAERVMVNLANFLCQKGYDVTILNYRSNESPYALYGEVKRKFLYDKAESYGFFNKVIRYFFTAQYVKHTVKDRARRLKKFIKKNDTDCYLVMLESATAELLELREYVKCPIIVSERNYPESYPLNVKQKLYDLSRFADGFVFQTESAKKCYGDGVKKSTVIPNAVNELFVDSGDDVIDKTKVIINAGRLESQKNQRLLIKAFAESGLTDHTLEIYGDGPLKAELQDLIESLDIQDRVFLKGYSNDLKNIMKRSSLFVLSSDYEGIPNVLLEAMALGLPCVTTDFSGGGAHTLIDDGENGIIVRAGDEKGLSAAIKNVLTDGVLAKKISDGAKEKVKQFYPDIVYGKWDAFIKEICNDFVRSDS